MSSPVSDPAGGTAIVSSSSTAAVHDDGAEDLLRRGAVLLRRYPHVAQEGSQDCGLACARMLLRGLSVSQAEAAFADALLASGLGQSVWSPDLLRLLLHCGLRARLYSRCLLPNPDYASLRYYRDEFSSDQQRVARNLAWIRDHHPEAAVQQGHLPIGAVLDHLAAGLGPVICLIDAGKTDAALLKSCLKCGCLSPACSSGGSYQGHYILVCGFSRRSYSVIYRDPMSRQAQYKSLSYGDFDRARTAYGTDEDLIFVFE